MREGVRPGWIVVAVDGSDVTTSDLETVVTRIREALLGCPVREGRVLALTFLLPDNDRVTCRTSQNNRKPNSKDADVTGLVLFLSQKHTKGRLNKGAIEEAAAHFPFKRSSIQRIWRKARPGVLDPDVVVDLEHKKKG